MLAEELPGARLVEASSLFEWRIRPERLTEALAGFLDEVWGVSKGQEPPFVVNGNGRDHAVVES
jgi:hypothetical protein